MDSEVVLGKITAAAVDFIDLSHSTGQNFDLGADGGAIGLTSHQLKAHPVICFVTLVAKNSWPAIDVFNDDIYGSIIVEIARSSPPARLRSGDSSAGQVAHVAKLAIVLVEKDDLALSVLRAIREAVYLRVHVTIHYKQVRPAVVVQVNAAGSPTEIWNCESANAGRKRNLGKRHGSIITIERVALILEIGDVDGKSSAMIKVTRSHTHSGHLASIPAHSGAGEKAQISEMSAAVITIEIVWS